MSRQTTIYCQILIAVFVLSLTCGTFGWADDQRGQALFRLCIACHGPQGEGRIDVGAPAIAGLPEWYVGAQVLKFRQGIRGAHPQDLAGMRMRPMARSLPTDTDVESVAKHVAALPSSGSAVPVTPMYLGAAALSAAPATSGRRREVAPPCSMGHDR